RRDVEAVLLGPADEGLRVAHLGHVGSHADEPHAVASGQVDVLQPGDARDAEHAPAGALQRLRRGLHVLLVAGRRRAVPTLSGAEPDPAAALAPPESRALQ